MASIHVLNHVGQIEGSQGIGDTLAIPGCRPLAGGQVDVGHQVWQRIGLDEQGEGRVWIGPDDIRDDYETAAVSFGFNLLEEQAGS